MKGFTIKQVQGILDAATVYPVTITIESDKYIADLRGLPNSPFVVERKTITGVRVHHLSREEFLRDLMLTE